MVFFSRLDLRRQTKKRTKNKTNLYLPRRDITTYKLPVLVLNPNAALQGERCYNFFLHTCCYSCGIFFVKRGGGVVIHQTDMYQNVSFHRKFHLSPMNIPLTESWQLFQTPPLSLPKRMRLLFSVKLFVFFLPIRYSYGKPVQGKVTISVTVRDKPGMFIFRVTRDPDADPDTPDEETHQLEVCSSANFFW